MSSVWVDGSPLVGRARFSVRNHEPSQKLTGDVQVTWMHTSGGVAVGAFNYVPPFFRGKRTRVTTSYEVERVALN